MPAVCAVAVHDMADSRSRHSCLKSGRAHARMIVGRIVPLENMASGQRGRDQIAPADCRRAETPEWRKRRDKTCVER